MTFQNQSPIYPGSFPYRDPPPDIPKNHTGWIALVLFGTVLLVIGALIIGFWRAADAPAPVLEAPTIEAPATPPTQTPQPR